MERELWFTLGKASRQTGISTAKMREAILTGELNCFPGLDVGSHQSVRLSEVRDLAAKKGWKLLPPPAEPIITLQQAARATGIDYVLLRKYVRARMIPSVKICQAYPPRVRLSQVQACIKEVERDSEESLSDSIGGDLSHAARLKGIARACRELQEELRLTANNAERLSMERRISLITADMYRLRQETQSGQADAAKDEAAKINGHTENVQLSVG